MASTARNRAVIDRDLAVARLCRVLGHPTRVAIIRLLLERDRTVSELIGELGAPQSRVSNHLACLRWCGFVQSTRRGRLVTYRLTDRRIVELLDQVDLIAADRLDHLLACRRIGPDWI
jgi:ArsR family transcriptional regulator, cadmium/lead-responsive transcriptional repressor